MRTVVTLTFLWLSGCGGQIASDGSATDSARRDLNELPSGDAGARAGDGVASSTNLESDGGAAVAAVASPRPQSQVPCDPMPPGTDSGHVAQAGDITEQS